MSPTATKARLCSLIVAAMTAAAPFSAHSQTLGELADAQRAKQQAEILLAQKELEKAEEAAKLKSLPAAPSVQATAAGKTEPRTPAPPERPKVVLHALYARGDVWMAELASEQRLAVALVGMQIDGHRITAIDRSGVVLTKPCTPAHVRAKARCGQRLLKVGEAI